MTITTKVGTGAIVASSLAGLSAAGGRQLRQEEQKINTVQQTTKISDLIDQKYDYILLDTSDSNENKDKEKWAENWKLYKSSGNNVFELDGWDASNENLDLTPALREKCKDLANSNSSDGLYENVINYCARSVTIADEAERKKLKILDVNGGNDWNVWYKRGDAANTLQKELGLLKVGQKDDGYSIKASCKAIVATDKKDPEYTDIFNAYEKVCTRQKGDPK